MAVGEGVQLRCQDIGEDGEDSPLPERFPEAPSPPPAAAAGFSVPVICLFEVMARMEPQNVGHFLSDLLHLA